LITAPAEKVLGYQVAMSIPILGFSAWLTDRARADAQGRCKSEKPFGLNRRPDRFAVSDSSQYLFSARQRGGSNGTVSMPCRRRASNDR
jgi:hypothetical protein